MRTPLGVKVQLLNELFLSAILESRRAIAFCLRHYPFHKILALSPRLPYQIVQIAKSDPIYNSYMGTIVATRFNPVIRTFYQRLCAAGKAKKVALTACMCKFLIILNAMLKHRRPWCHMGHTAEMGPSRALTRWCSWVPGQVCTKDFRGGIGTSLFQFLTGKTVADHLLHGIG